MPERVSQTVVTYPIVGVLVKAEDMKGMGQGRVWTAVNSMQDKFLSEVFVPCHYETERIPELESVASWSVEEINGFLAKKGFSIRLEPIGPETFAVASVLDVLVKWLREGLSTTLVGEDKKTYPAVRLNEHCVRYLAVQGHKDTVIQVLTETNDMVYMTPNKGSASGLELLNIVEDIQRQPLKPLYHEYSDFVFPMVNLDQEVDISWLLGMHTQGSDGQPAIITQALQQTKLKMNEKGALAKSAVAVAVMRSAVMEIKPDYVLNKPFLMWIERPGLAKPLFVGHLQPDVWSNPGNLD